MRLRSFPWLLAGLFALWPAAAQAGGLELREQGALAISMSDAVTARCDHASTVYFNPAGMAFLEGVQVAAGVTMVFPDFSYSDPDGNFSDATTRTDLVAPPHLYATYRPHEMFAVGVSFNVPFGLGIDWPDDFPGTYISKRSFMSVYLINPSIALRPLENLSIGAGIQLMPGSVEIQRRFGMVTRNGNLEMGGVDLAGTAFGVGGNIGIMYRPVDWVYLGYFFRSRVAMDFEGDAHFRVPEGVTDRSVFHDQRAKAFVTLPDYMTFGVGFSIADDLVYIEADLDYVLWSAIQELVVEFPDDASGQLTQPKREEWRDTVTPRVAVQWRALDRPNHLLFVRAGGGYDWSPAPSHTLSPLMPDSNRIFASAGLGYTYRPWGVAVDVGYMLSYFVPRSVDESDCSDDLCNSFPADYSNTVHILAIDLTWSYE